MYIYKTRAELDKLKTVLELPEDIKAKEVEIIIFADDMEVSQNNEDEINLAGVFKEYANPVLIDKEKDIAWLRLSRRKISFT